jgi:hypothetical protein
MAQLISRLTATIALSGYLSDALTTWGAHVTCIEMPTLWTTAVMTFQGSQDGVNYYNILNDDGDEFIAFVYPSARIYVAHRNLDYSKYIKLRSGTHVNLVNQAAARTIYVEVWNG